MTWLPDNSVAAPRSRQYGLTLIELMIALVLGLIIVSAVLNVYAGSTRSARFTGGLQSLQENGRFGVLALTRGLRRAGYSTNDQLAPFDFSLATADTIVLQEQKSTDCNGQPAPGGVAVNTYSLDTTTAQIICRGNSATPIDMPLVDGVYGFRVLYGLDLDDDRVSERYVPYDSTLDPLKINSVRFAMLVASDRPMRKNKVQETHMLLDTPYLSDSRLFYRVFTTTVLLRNRR